jgi:hypothetical protein
MTNQKKSYINRPTIIKFFTAKTNNKIELLQK